MTLTPPEIAETLIIVGLAAIVFIQDKVIQKLRKQTASLFDRNEKLRAQLAKFDHDGDGKPGGSKPKVKK